MLKVEFVNLRSIHERVPPHEDEWREEIEAEIRISVGGILVLEQEWFPVVDLADALHRWRKTLVEGRRDFSWCPWDAEDEEVVLFTAQNGKWRVSSSWGGRSAILLSDTAIVNAIVEYENSLLHDCKRLIGVSPPLPLQ